MNILIVGAYPPPTGGNSVHIKRLQEALEYEGKSCAIIDLYGKPSTNTQIPSVYRVGPAGIKSFFKCLSVIREKTYDIIHFHVSAMERFLYAGYVLIKLSPPTSKKIITIHSGQFVDAFKLLLPIKQKIIVRLLRQFGHVIVVNNGQKQLLESIGVPSQKISVIPAYIPPTPKPFLEAEKILGYLHNDDRIILVSSGYGEPLYGYHRIISAIKENPLLNRRVSLLLCLYNRFDKNYMEQVNHLAHELESIKILYDLGSEEFAYLLSKSQIYIRATDVDGDAVAIREAAQFGLTVIASNVGERPGYCHLFNLDDSENLAKQITLCAATPSTESAANLDIESTVNKIFSIYSR